MMIMNVLRSLFGKKTVHVPNHSAEVDELGFITTLQREFTVIIFNEFEDWLIHRDEVDSIFADALGLEDDFVTLEMLRNLTESEIAKVTQVTKEYAEDDRITDGQIRAAIQNTIWHWSPSDRIV